MEIIKLNKQQADFLYYILRNWQSSATNHNEIKKDLRLQRELLDKLTK